MDLLVGSPTQPPRRIPFSRAASNTPAAASATRKTSRGAECGDAAGNCASPIPPPRLAQGHAAFVPRALGRVPTHCDLLQFACLLTGRSYPTTQGYEFTGGDYCRMMRHVVVVEGSDSAAPSSPVDVALLPPPRSGAMAAGADRIRTGVVAAGCPMDWCLSTLPTSEQERLNRLTFLRSTAEYVAANGRTSNIGEFPLFRLVRHSAKGLGDHLGSECHGGVPGDACEEHQREDSDATSSSAGAAARLLDNLIECIPFHTAALLWLWSVACREGSRVDAAYDPWAAVTTPRATSSVEPSALAASFGNNQGHYSRPPPATAAAASTTPPVATTKCDSWIGNGDTAATPSAPFSDGLPQTAGPPGTPTTSFLGRMEGGPPLIPTPMASGAASSSLILDQYWKSSEDQAASMELTRSPGSLPTQVALRLNLEAKKTLDRCRLLCLTGLNMDAVVDFDKIGRLARHGLNRNF